MRDGFQVFPQKVAPEIAAEIAPDRVNVVRVVLRVVVLDEEGRTLHPVVMLLAPFGLTRPRKPDLVDARFLDPRHAVRCDVGGHR